MLKWKQSLKKLLTNQKKHNLKSTVYIKAPGNIGAFFITLSERGFGGITAILVQAKNECEKFYLFNTQFYSFLCKTFIVNVSYN